MKEIYLGLDLCKKHIQLSYFREDKQEPESIYQLNNAETYQLPNVMFYSKPDQKWYVGNSVSVVRFQQDGTIIEDILERIDSDDNVVIDDVSYTYDELLLILLKTHIKDFLQRSAEYCLKSLTVTIETYHPTVYRVLEQLQEEFSLSTETFYIMSHENAFFQYVMNQEEKLRTNSVAMFEYGHEGMDYYRIDKKRQGNNQIFYLSRFDMRKEMPYSKLFGDVEELDRYFAGLAKAKMREAYISMVYLTGPGFNDKWIEETTNVLCDGRRVFMGQNIYTKGACYHARYGDYGKDKGFVLRTDATVPFDIGVSVGEMEGKNRFYPIAIGGREWYNVKGKVTLFLDDTNRIDLIYQDKLTKEMQKEIIEIHGLPKRPPKTTKISLQVELLDEKLGAIIIRDVGFGKIYPTTNKIYRKEFSVQ